MSQALFVIAPHSAECKAEVSLDRSETRRLADKLKDRFLVYRVVVIDPVSRKWWKAEAPNLTDPKDTERQCLPQRSQTPELLFVVVPHIDGPSPRVCVNLVDAAEVACNLERGCRIVVVNSDTTDIPNWMERLFKGPEHGTDPYQLRDSIAEELSKLADELATDG